METRSQSTVSFKASKNLWGSCCNELFSFVRTLRNLKTFTIPFFKQNSTHKHVDTIEMKLDRQQVVAFDHIRYPGKWYLFVCVCIFPHTEYTWYQMQLDGWTVRSIYHISSLESELFVTEEKECDAFNVKTGHIFIAL